jgi:hypothetical protein
MQQKPKKQHTSGALHAAVLHGPDQSTTLICYLFAVPNPAALTNRLEEGKMLSMPEKGLPAYPWQIGTLPSHPRNGDLCYA